ncbi:YidC/Oxa1 family membrane protein insertase [Oceanivirga salmonicida]|uniref:YidC/Oxa1 family membrane protein insertase n=1 Tax=Oceanivirga salmonicida TaxID=1769291 RepID=UPI00082BAE7F|nr:YidC/Oxa1 family membrane protein insertase [Oceanivirga salmonicida]
MNFLRIPFIENLLLKLLSFLAEILGNYGLAIIATTIIIKLILYPLTVKQEKSMAKMKKYQPEIDAINKKYKSDRAKLSEETTKLYREKGINPLGGCLPLLIQLPIFIMLYHTFTSNAIPKTASFLWFNLAQPDRLYTISGFDINLLPLLGGLLSFVQQRIMMPKNSDSAGAENTMQTALLAMPVIMTFFFYRLPSGLNLYYVLNMLITLLLQRYIQAKVREENE